MGRSEPARTTGRPRARAGTRPSARSPPASTPAYAAAAVPSAGWAARSSTACRSTSDPARSRSTLDPRRRARRRSSFPAAGRPAMSWSPTCATRGATMPAGGRPGWPSDTSSRSASRSPGTRWSTGRGARRAGSSAAGSRSTTGSSAGGSAPFAAIPHLANEVVDWRGPHPAQVPGRYAAAGQSGTLTIMPGTYGDEPDGRVRLRAERDRRRAPVAPRDRARRRRRAGRAAPRAARRRPARERRARRRP